MWCEETALHNALEKKSPPRNTLRSWFSTDLKMHLSLSISSDADFCMYSTAFRLHWGTIPAYTQQESRQRHTAVTEAGGSSCLLYWPSLCCMHLLVRQHLLLAETAEPLCEWDDSPHAGTGRALLSPFLGSEELKLFSCENLLYSSL